MSDSDDRELELLLQQLKENTDIDLRCHAAQQLGMKKSQAKIAVPALIEALNDDNWLVRVEAATALSKLGRAAESAIEPLTDTMNEPRNRSKRGIYYEAIQALKIAQSEEPEVTPSVIVEEPKEEFIPEEIVEESVIVEETPVELDVEPIVESSFEALEEEVIEDAVEEPIVEDTVVEVTTEVVEEAKVVDDFVMDEETEDLAEEIIDEAFDDADEDFQTDTTPEVVDEIAEDIAEEITYSEPVIVAEPEVQEEVTIGEDITEIVEDIADDISEDTTDEEIIEEAIEEIAEEVLEDVLEDAVGDTVDHEIIDDIAEEITEEVLEKEEDDDEEELEKPVELEEPTESFQAPIVEDPVIEPEEEVTEAVSLDEVLEFEDDKKKLDDQPPSIVAPTVEDVKTVKMSTALLKIVLVGDAAVGKTAFRKKYCDVEFSEEYRDIIGADFATKHFTKNGENFAMQIWDIAAKERFQNSKELFFKSLYGAVLIFDVTNRESFKNIHNWLADIQSVESKEIAVVLVGNKIDLRPDQEGASITREEGQELAAKLSEKTGFSISYVETSVETGAGVEVAFRMLEERAAELFFSARDK
ncbi:MAG: GTP-binding protein [Candidatus Heimdallarchaeota archaeon]|nr:GTP-binding protein [Candidatus Heimdallarchaeota archaeon]